MDSTSMSIHSSDWSRALLFCLVFKQIHEGYTKSSYHQTVITFYSKHGIILRNASRLISITLLYICE
jgi:hypothetical protein